MNFVYFSQQSKLVQKVDHSFFLYVVIKLSGISQSYSIFSNLKFKFKVSVVWLTGYSVCTVYSQTYLDLPVWETRETWKMFWYELESSLIFPEFKNFMLLFGLRALPNVSSTVEKLS